MSVQQDITLENIYKVVIDLQHELKLLRERIFDEPELRDEFIYSMRDIDLEKTILVEDFSKRYGLK